MIGFAGTREAVLASHVDDDGVQKLDTLDSMGRKQQATTSTSPACTPSTLPLAGSDESRNPGSPKQEILLRRNPVNYPEFGLIAPDARIAADRYPYFGCR